MTFRVWCQRMWYEHLEEFESWFHTLPTYDSKEYFAKYKYWLKREYQHQKEQGVL